MTPCHIGGPAETEEMRITIRDLLRVIPSGWDVYTGYGAGLSTNHGITVRPAENTLLDDGRRVELMFGQDVQAFGPFKTKGRIYHARQPITHPERFKGRGWRKRLVARVAELVKSLGGDLQGS